MSDLYQAITNPSESVNIPVMNDHETHKVQRLMVESREWSAIALDLFAMGQPETKKNNSFRLLIASDLFPL